MSTGALEELSQTPFHKLTECSIMTSYTQRPMRFRNIEFRWSTCNNKYELVKWYKAKVDWFRRDEDENPENWRKRN
jgi:hypothetical protein